MDVHLGLSSSHRDFLTKAVKLWNKAIALDENQDLPHYMLGMIYSISRKLDKAMAECERAIVLNPNSSAASNSLVRSIVIVQLPLCIKLG
jgi:tetratricopeptide (TPR) repeat protein